MDAATTATVKAKKERKPFEWTEARKAAFERCKKARDTKLVSKAKAQSEGKTYESTKQKQMQNLVKNASLLRKLLDGIEDEKKVEEKVKPPPQAEVVKEKKEVKEKPRKVTLPPPPPQAESSEEEEEEEQVFVAPPKKNVNPFRYNTVSSKQFIPKAPIPTQQRFERPPERQEMVLPKKPGYLFL
jgi:hypothetical protein